MNLKRSFDIFSSSVIHQSCLFSSLPPQEHDELFFRNSNTSLHHQYKHATSLSYSSSLSSYHSCGSGCCCISWLQSNFHHSCWIPSNTSLVLLTEMNPSLNTHPMDFLCATSDTCTPCWDQDPSTFVCPTDDPPPWWQYPPHIIHTLAAQAPMNPFVLECNPYQNSSCDTVPSLNRHLFGKTMQQCVDSSFEVPQQNAIATCQERIEHSSLSAR